MDTNTATQAGLTDGGGNLRYVWRPKAATSLSNITVSETPPSAYTPAKAWCTSEGVTIFSSEVPAVVSSFTLMGLKVRDKVDCTVRNRLKRSTVRVVKNWVGAASSAAIFVDRNGRRTVRRVNGCDHQRRQHLLRLSGLDAGIPR